MVTSFLQRLISPLVCGVLWSEQTGPESYEIKSLERGEDNGRRAGIGELFMLLMKFYAYEFNYGRHNITMNAFNFVSSIREE